MQLKFNDYGYTEWVSAECMRPIRREFLEVTWQAQKCRLVDIFPLLGDAWPQDTCEQFQMLIGGKTCSIEIKVIISSLFHLPFSEIPSVLNDTVSEGMFD